jgi:hypothetical protein
MTFPPALCSGREGCGARFPPDRPHVGVVTGSEREIVRGSSEEKYSPEYKDEALKMVLENSGRSIASVARDLGIK